MVSLCEKDCTVLETQEYHGMHNNGRTAATTKIMNDTISLSSHR